MAFHHHDLQNSYGPGIVPSDGPQTITSDAPEALHLGGPSATMYATQAEKNIEIVHGPSSYRRKTWLGVPVVICWAGLAGLLIAIGLGVGLGVGLSVSSRTSRGAATSGSSSNTPAATTATGMEAGSSTSTTVTPTTSSGGTTTVASTTTSASATATGASVNICQNAYLDLCTTISVPSSSCINFSSEYNDTISSLDTGGPVCLLYTDPSCTGDYWSTNGTQDLIPGAFNDAFSSISCD